jgi:hypothetical protein
MLDIKPQEFARLLMESIIAPKLKKEILDKLPKMTQADLVTMYNIFREEKLKRETIMLNYKRKMNDLQRKFREKLVFYEGKKRKTSIKKRVVRVEKKGG